MKKIVIVGFGNMGCRHVQSILENSAAYEIHVVEPSEENIKANAARIGCDPNSITWHKSLETLHREFSAAVVTTSAAPRFHILKTLLAKGIKRFLVEKVVFQSVEQFDEILGLMQENGAEMHCNFVRRYITSYNTIKNELAAKAEKDRRAHV